MAIQVIIKRKIRQGFQANKLVPLILQMRARAMYQPGYISGETLCEIEQPGECKVISKWETIEDWNEWAHNNQRLEIKKIGALIGEKSEVHIYASMVPHRINDKVPGGQTEC